jgi:hypothetical protein
MVSIEISKPVPFHPLISINPNVAKVGGLQSQGAKGAAVVVYCKPLATRDLKSSGFPAGEKRWPKIDPILKFTVGLFL